jgi:uncharacterized protein (DUF885 family)
MARRLVRIAAGLALSAIYWAGPAVALTRADRDVAALVADYEKLDRAADPITAGYDGEAAALRLLPDVSPAARAAERAGLSQLAARLQRVDTRRLSPDAALNDALLTRVIGWRIEAVDFDQDRIPFANADGFFNTLGYLARTTPIQNAADAEAWIARLEAAPAFFAQNIANARRGLASGFTQPRIIVERALAFARGQADSLPDALIAPLMQLPATIPAEAQDAARARARAVISERVMPAYANVVAFLQNEYLPVARESLGMRAAPGGEAYYRFLVRFHTTTDLTPEQIHALGEQEVARIRHEMDAVIAETGFHGDFAAFLNFLHSDPRFYTTTPQDLMEKSALIAKRAEEQLPRLFGALPRLPYGVRAIPAAEAEGATTAYYQPGSPQLGQPGEYMVNLTHLDQRPLYEMPALTLHEAVPGHHLQIALAQEAGDLPYFRRNLYFTAFTEGWGLYAEFLGEEMGMYATPYERFGRLSYEMWRACRLVADTGIHWMGWSMDQARQCFAENTALSPHNIQTELERYVADPGQALAYKIGELRLKALRREAETALGPRFDVRAFHDEVLSAGALPLDVLQTRVRAWIAAQR